ncbi:MAG: glycosyltransferase family 2 protein [Dehalococcoidia bacterium]
MVNREAKTPTISVVMPTYNRGYIIRRAIDSVIAQTCTDWEMVIVDDGSNDDTEEIIASYGDSRIVYLRQDSAKKGAAAARNLGIATSRGEYVAFIDSDDEWLPQKLEKQLEVFQTTDLENVGVVICGRKIFEPQGETIVVPNRRGWVRQDLLALRGNLSNINMMIRKSAAQDQLWFDESLKSSEEWDLQLRLAGVSQYDFCTDIVVHKFELSNDRVFSGTNIPDWLSVVLDRYDTELRAMPDVMARHWGGIGLTYWNLGYPQKARQAVRRALKARFWSLRLHLYFLSTFTGKAGLMLTRTLQRAVAS